MRFQELKGSSRFFTFLSLPFPTFFLRLPVASVVSFQVPFKGGEAGNTRFFGKILPNGVEIFSKTEGSTFYFQSPLPYLCTCTITVDAKRKDHVEERKSEWQMKIETSRKFWGCTKGLHHKSEQTFCHNRRINMNKAHNLHCSWGEIKY